MKSIINFSSLYRINFMPGLLLCLSACSPVAFDRSNSTVGTHLRAGCYQTNTESNLYKRIYSDALSGIKAGEYLMQTGLPLNEWEFSKFGKNWIFVDTIPVGTEFSISGVYDQDWGKDGIRWLIYGKFDNIDFIGVNLVDSNFKETGFIIPSGIHVHSGQVWITPATVSEDSSVPEFKPQFVRSCIS